MRLFCVSVVLCLGSGLTTGWSLVQGVLPSVKNDYGSGFVRVSSQLLTTRFIKTHGACLLLLLMGLFGPTFICVRVGEPTVRNEWINVYHSTLFHSNCRRRLKIRFLNWYYIEFYKRFIPTEIVNEWNRPWRHTGLDVVERRGISPLPGFEFRPLDSPACS
jgi:hypothetical protein